MGNVHVTSVLITRSYIKYYLHCNYMYLHGGYKKIENKCSFVHISTESCTASTWSTECKMNSNKNMNLHNYFNECHSCQVHM